MKKILENFKSWIVIWCGILITLIIWWVLYATLTFEDLPEVTSWDTLTSQSWNDLINAVNLLKAETNAISSYVDSLNETINSIDMALPNAPVSYDVLYNWKYYKSFWTTKMTWDSAFGSSLTSANSNGCPSLGEGWRLPIMWELRDLYRAKIANSSYFTTLNLQNDYYWADGNNNLTSSYGTYADILDMGNGAYWFSNRRDRKLYVVCIHD
jgi:hypothetical protein